MRLGAVWGGGCEAGSGEGGEGVRLGVVRGEGVRER